ncbi:MAG TPA: FeoA family protein [Burkholderiaceae bacterium]|nr:FeoA family protein [Burkholderiaceae bacterium]
MGVIAAVLALARLPRGCTAEVVRIERSSGSADALADRLQELGFLDGARVRILNRGVAGGPLAVRVGSTTFALRGAEAERVLVRLPPN